MQILRRVSLGALALLTLALPAAGRPLDAALTAVAYGPILPGAAFQVRTTDDSELAEQVRGLVEAALRARHYAVVDDAPLVLTIETETPVSAGAAEGTLGRIDVDSDHGVAIILNLWSSRGDSLLRSSPERPAGDRFFRIAVAVHDQATRRYVWRGSIGGAQGDTSVLAASKVAVPILVDAIGRTVEEHTVWLR